MNVFVTGATGFIGGALARALVTRGHEVTALARDPGRAPAIAGVRWVGGELGPAAGLDEARAALASAEAVAHLAAVRRDWGLSEAELKAINVDSGPRLLELSSSARRFLLVSSVAVYGHNRDGAADESAPYGPEKRYGVSKVEAERAMRSAADARGTPLTVARPGIIYGPGDTYGMIANLARLLARGRFLLVGSGTSRVNVLYIDDLANALGDCLEAEAAAGEDLILAGPEPVTVRRLVDAVAVATGGRVPRLAVPEWAARSVARVLETGYRAAGIEREPFLTKPKIDLFTRDDVFATTKARRLIGFAPKIGLDEGLRRAVEWLRGAGEL